MIIPHFTQLPAFCGALQAPTPLMPAISSMMEETIARAELAYRRPVPSALPAIAARALMPRSASRPVIAASTPPIIIRIDVTFKNF